MTDSSGYFGIGIYQAKRFENVGVLWRGAYQLGASYIFTIGKRYRRQIVRHSRHLETHSVALLHGV